MNIRDTKEYGLSQALLDKLLKRGMETFTSAQVEALKSGLCRGENLLVCAPTSSGKTTIAEIAAVEGALRGHRTVYLVSHRALAEEKYRLFLNEYAISGSKWFDVSIATGDRTEGVWDSGILIATYEKYLALLCGSTEFSMNDKVVVADEIQILGDEGRGPDIELLCTLIRRGKPRQLVALSATISNPRDIAEWLGCKVVEIKVRDVPLRQEVWFRGQCQYSNAGDTEIFEGDESVTHPEETLEALDWLLENGRGPALVFTMTKPRATQLAQTYAARRQRAAHGLLYVEQLELFSEPSTLVRTLSDTSQKGIAFHTADLNYSERAVVERGLTARMFDVVFATPTLAAGVNFPFQTVLFDSYFRRFIPSQPWLPQSDYQNMSGRAGRLGLHDKGYAVLIAHTDVEYHKAIELLSTAVAPLRSEFLSCSLRKVVLTMIASRVIRRIDELHNFFKDTLWWYQTLDSNPEKLKKIPAMLDEAIQFLVDTSLASLDGEKIFATRLGVATAASGLLPQSVVFLLNLVKEKIAIFSREPDFWTIPIIHAICACDEFGDRGQRRLPFARNNQPETGAWMWLQKYSLFLNPNTIENTDIITNATYGLAFWMDGTEEQALKNMLPSISYGQMQQLGMNASWILEGFSEILRVPDAGVPYTVANSFGDLAERLRFGVPTAALDLLKAAAFYDVPGFGRHRAMALYNMKLSDPNQILKTGKKLLVKILESEPRAEQFIEAILKFFEMPLEVWKIRHTNRAQSVHIDPVLIQQAYDLIGGQYETPIHKLLEHVVEWSVTKLDSGKRQGYPDFLISFNGKNVLFECKTKEKDTATISKDDAFAVLTKGTDFKKDHSVTLGKPDFDSFSRSKANGSAEITLIKHQDFIESIIRYKAGKVSAEQVFDWLMIPGYAQMSTLFAMVPA